MSDGPITERGDPRDRIANQRDLNTAPVRPRDRLFVNDERTVLVRIWSDSTVEVAIRATPAHTWGPPVYLTEEK